MVIRVMHDATMMHRMHLVLTRMAHFGGLGARGRRQGAAGSLLCPGYYNIIFLYYHMI